MQAKVKKKMQQDPPEIPAEFHTVFALLAADFIRRKLCALPFVLGA